jgi:hypothetical protein
MRRKMNVYRLGVLARAARLNNWEQNFVRDVAEERRLSPRQQAKLNEIWSVHQEEVSS